MSHDNKITLEHVGQFIIKCGEFHDNYCIGETVLNLSHLTSIRKSIKLFMNILEDLEMLETNALV